MINTSSMIRTMGNNMDTQANMPSHKDVFDSTKTIKEHISHYSSDVEKYTSRINEAISNKLNINSAVKARILIAIWTHSSLMKEQGKRSSFDNIWDNWNMTASDVFKFVQLLDAPREARSIQYKLRMWEDKKVPVKKGKVARLEATVKTLMEEDHPGNLTSSLAKRIRSWVNKIPADQLDFYILNFEETICRWKQLADLCHLKETDFQSPYFLSVIFGKDVPVESRLYALKNINTDNFVHTVERYPGITKQYSFLRKKIKSGELRLCAQNAKAFAGTAPLGDLIWFYEELSSSSGITGVSELDSMISSRLDLNESIENENDDRATFPAKLIERIMMFMQKNKSFASKLIPYAEERLSILKVPEGEKYNIAILGDNSASMQVAVKTASIISGLLSIGLNAEVVFFNDKVNLSPLKDTSGRIGKSPETVEEVLTVATKIDANNCTSPAAAMRHFYEDVERKIDLFIVVTDEEENTPCTLNSIPTTRGYRHHYYDCEPDGIEYFNFAQLFRKYRYNINPKTKIMFISFLEKSTIKGRMVNSIEKNIPGCVVKQYRLDGHLPDLSKFSELLGMVREILRQPDTFDTPNTKIHVFD